MAKSPVTDEYTTTGEPRKVHLFTHQSGQTLFGRRYSNTLCRGNFPAWTLRTTHDPLAVTCRRCRAAMQSAPIGQEATPSVVPDPSRIAAALRQLANAIEGVPD